MRGTGRERLNEERGDELYDYERERERERERENLKERENDLNNIFGFTIVLQCSSTFRIAL